MRRSLPWVVLLVSLVAVAWVASLMPGRDLVRAGAASLDLGEVPEALATLSPAAASPLASPWVHYDLGVAYYRDGDIPRALAHWRHARELRPRDPSLVHNIALARSQLEGVPAAVGPAAGWEEWVTPWELGLLATFLLGLASFLLVRIHRQGEGPLSGPVALGLVGAVLGLTAVHGSMVQRGEPVAVVVDVPAVLRDSASPQAPATDSLPPGTELRVLRQFSGFYLVLTGGGQRGWVPTGAVLSPHAGISREGQASSGALYPYGTSG